jgi:hypothetical protein
MSVMLFALVPTFGPLTVRAAVVTSLPVRRTINAPGRIVLVGNTLLTCRTAVRAAPPRVRGRVPKMKGED